jgi:hypothetical protein
MGHEKNGLLPQPLLQILLQIHNLGLVKKEKQKTVRPLYLLREKKGMAE